MQDDPKKKDGNSPQPKKFYWKVEGTDILHDGKYLREGQSYVFTETERKRINGPLKKGKEKK